MDRITRIRRKQENHETQPCSELPETNEKIKMVRLGRIFYPYRVLLLFSFIICALQVFMGFSFFNNTKDEEIKLHNSPSSPPSPSPSVLDDNYKCNVSTETKSALKRAKTEQCRTEILDLACRVESGTFFPSSLPRYCDIPSDPSIAGRRLGCFRDNFSTRILDGNLGELTKDNSPSNCIRFCTKSGYMFAGTQFGVECFCGNTSPKPELKLVDTACNKKCSGDQSIKCGGYLTMDIYHTGLQPPKVTNLASVEASETPAKVVFLLTLNGRALRQVLRLIRVLNGPGSYFYIHIDSRQEYLYRELDELSRTMSNLKMVRRRFASMWGGVSLLTMLLSSIQELLEIKDWDWDFVLNLSESDYPVKRREELFQFLSSNKDKNFLKSHGRNGPSFIKKQGLDKTFFQCEDHMWRIGSRSLPEGIQIDGGSDWICLNREFSSYIVNSEDELISGLKLVFNFTLLPAETFFHTALQNSRFCSSGVNNNLHLTNWRRKLGCKCQYKHIVDWCGCSPNDFLSEDQQKLKATQARQIFFARKFEPIIHHEIINWVDDWLDIQVPGEPGEQRNHYWQNLFHHKDVVSNHPEQFNLLIEFLAREYVLSSPDLKEFKLLRVLEVTLHKYKDEIKDFLLLSELQNTKDESVLIIEIKVDLLDGNLEENKLVSSKPKIVSVSVGTDYDPKERVFRNFLRNYGSRSEMSLRVEFEPGQEKERIEFGWFNPLGLLSAVTHAKTNESQGLENVIPNLDKPLLPGVWTVVGVNQASLISSNQFLILPGAELNQVTPDRDPIQSHLSQYYKMDPEKTISVKNDLNTLNLESRDAWMRKYSAGYYKVEHVCSLQPGAGFEPCGETSWSSRKQDLSILV